MAPGFISFGWRDQDGINLLDSRVQSARARVGVRAAPQPCDQHRTSSLAPTRMPEQRFIDNRLRLAAPCPRLRHVPT